MKTLPKAVLCLVLIIKLQGFAYAQVAQGINFQAIARQTDGRPVPNKQVSVRISILNGGPSGMREYREQHFPTTDQIGMFDLIVGKGNVISGQFADIDWAANSKWIQIEIDPNGGTNFTIAGSQQFMTVPYAMYATKAGNVIPYKGGKGISISGDEISNEGDDDNDPNNELIKSVAIVNNKLLITDAGGVKEADLSKYDSQPLNLGDVLGLGNDAGNNTISNLGNPVNEKDAVNKYYVDNLDIRDDDADPTNEIQDLIMENNELKISKNINASIINLSPYLDNTDEQTISLEVSGINRKISIENGNEIEFNVADNDNDPNNEIQDLVLDGNVLKINNNPDATEIDLSAFLDNTDNQTLSLSTSGTNRTVSISGGNQIVINVADNDNSSTNEIQDLVLTGNTLRISNNANATNIDLAPYLDNSDNQTLSLTSSGTERTISISGGNQVVLNVADNDNSPTNEVQTLTRVGTTITLSQAGGTGGGNVQINDMMGNRIFNVGYPLGFSEAANRNYVEDRIQNLRDYVDSRFAQCNCIFSQFSIEEGLNSDPQISLFSQTSDTSIQPGLSILTTEQIAFNAPALLSGAGINRIVNLSTGSSGFSFDDHQLINGNRFIAKEGGVYQFTINASSTARNARLKLVLNGNQTSAIMKTGENIFQETLLIKLRPNDYIEIIADHPTSGTLRGNFSGHKL